MAMKGQIYSVTMAILSEIGNRNAWMLVNEETLDLTDLFACRRCEVKQSYLLYTLRKRPVLRLQCQTMMDLIAYRMLDIRLN